MKNIGIIIEFEPEYKSGKKKIKPGCFGVITLARQDNTELFAFVINSDIKALKPDLEAFGITNIVDVVLESEYQNNPVVRAKAMIKAVLKFHIDAIIGLSTSMGKDLLPRMAAQLDAPLVMNCIYVDFENNLAKTSQYSGKTIATVKTTGDISIFGVRPNSVEPINAQTSARILKFDGIDLVTKELNVLKTGENDKSTNTNLAEADIIIAGGRGIKNKDNFTILSQCAEKLNAAVGASRVAVDEGWVPYSMQVGQTGEKVSPKVYIACGISGSIQHFAGMKMSGMVIAVNTDENAPIISNCDYYVKADVLKIIPELTKLLNNE
jgi:electron transfer flavoprotein alpha subunit